MGKKFLLVNEIFYSLLGESSYSGYPAVFIRLSGCNLNCKYCDTRYANESGRYISIDSIIDEVKFYKVQRALITGGEPLLQGNSIFLMEKLISNGYTVLLETNGSLPLKKVPGKIIKIVDVKTPDSDEGGSFLEENLKSLKKGDNLKFVISSVNDFYWAVKFLKERKLPDGVEVLFSPVFGRFSPTNLAKLILEENIDVRLNLQIHKILNIK